MPAPESRLSAPQSSRLIHPSAVLTHGERMVPIFDASSVALNLMGVHHGIRCQHSSSRAMEQGQDLALLALLVVPVERCQDRRVKTPAIRDGSAQDTVTDFDLVLAEKVMTTELALQLSDY